MGWEEGGKMSGAIQSYKLQYPFVGCNLLACRQNVGDMILTEKEVGKLVQLEMRSMVVLGLNQTVKTHVLTMWVVEWLNQR